MVLKKILSVFFLLVLGVILNSVCTAAPLMVEKNLFAKDRKPPSPDSADTSGQPAKPGMAIGNIQLDGVIIQNNARKAILRMKNQPAGPSAKKGQPASPFVAVREGEMVSDYRVSKIESKSVSLEKEGQSFTIGLFAENKVVTPPSPAPMPAPAPVAGPQTAPAPGSQQPGVNHANGVLPQPNGIAGNQSQGMIGQQAPMAPNVHRVNRNIQQNAPNQDQNQAAETVDEEE